MAIGLLGGLALFLYGMEKMTDGLKAAAGEQMKRLLAKLTSNALSGAVTGAVVTAVIQSSSVTTVLVVGFVSAGLMTLVQSVGVIFGANVGTTVTAQIVAFNVTAASLPLITVGFFMTFLSKGGPVRHYGDMLMGLGLIFFGMAAMGDAMSPLRTNEGFINLMLSMERPILGILVGALFTALVQSSSATIGLAVVLATHGLVTVPSLALERARLEFGHMAEKIRNRLDAVPSAFEDRDVTETSKQHDAVVVLRDAIFEYLQRIGRESLTDEEAMEQARLISAANEMESLSSAISRELAPLSEAFADAGLNASESAGTLLAKVYGETQAAALQALQALIDLDERAAQDVVASRAAIWRMGRELLMQEAAKLDENDPERLLKHRLQVDALDKLQHIYTAAERMAITVLPPSVLAAEALRT